MDPNLKITCEDNDACVAKITADAAQFNAIDSKISSDLFNQLDVSCSGANS